MKKNFSIQFFRPPHMPLNEKQVDKYNSLIPPANTMTSNEPNSIHPRYLTLPGQSL